LRYLSVCSGIEAATQAWHPLGWQPVAFSEIEPFPCAVLKHHYPDVPNWGDMTKFQEWPDADVDVLVGGTPCQSFSVAGLRAGLADPRGNLMLTYLAIADRYRPKWLVWENVPGVFSADSHVAPDACPPDIDLDGDDGPCDGKEVVVEDWYEADETHAFACLLAGLQELGYGFAYRVLDAQFVRTCDKPFAVPQRRRRVFVVGYLGDWRRAAAVLFDRESMSGHPAPRRKAGEGPAPTIASRPTGGGGLGADFDCDGGLIAANSGDIGYCLTATAQQSLDAETETLIAVAHALPVAGPLSANGGTDRKHGFGMGQQDWENGYAVAVAHALRGEGHDASEDGTGRGVPLVPVAIQERAICENPNAGPDGAGVRQDGAAYTIEARTVPQAVAFSVKDHGGDAVEGISPTLRAGGFDGSHANGGVMPAVAFDLRGREGGAMPEGPHDTAALRAASGGSSRSYVAAPWVVRRLTPRECERLQGFPDDFTRIPYRGKPADQCQDGPRYKAIGNSMAVNVMDWIGERIAHVESIIAERTDQ
jgi:DNA (cytosine-5)-methyltransferase 1